MSSILTPPRQISEPRSKHSTTQSVLQFLFSLGAALVATSLVSHFVTSWLRIETTTGKPWIAGPPNRPLALMGGSSLAADGISWNRVSDELNLRIGGWGVAGSSPWEWETFQRKAP